LINKLYKLERKIRTKGDWRRRQKLRAEGKKENTQALTTNHHLQSPIKTTDKINFGVKKRPTNMHPFISRTIDV
jgi:hypothetical protein